MSSPKPANSSNNIRYAVAAFLCALPFLLGGFYLQDFARRVDTLPLDLYSGLRWVPGTPDLFYLHRPLEQNPPAKTEIWLVTSHGTSFNQVGTLSADYEWSTVPVGSDNWQLLEGEDSEGKTTRALTNLNGEVRPLKVEPEWKPLRSKGDGIFYFRWDDALPYEEFVEVEEVPSTSPEPASFEPEPDALATPTDGAPRIPTHKGITVGEYRLDQSKVEPILSIPYSTDAEKPTVELVRRSPDGRFLAMAVKFGPNSASGLWVFDQDNHRLLWTRILIQGEATGMAWSRDSVKVAITDSGGLVVLEQVLGVESNRVEMTGSVTLQPVWDKDGSLYVFNEHSVYSVDLEGDVAVPVFNIQGGDDLHLNVAESRVAYSTTAQGFRELVIAELKGGETLSQLPYPGAAKQEAQSTILYKIGNSLRYALNRWTGRG